MPFDAISAPFFLPIHLHQNEIDNPPSGERTRRVCYPDSSSSTGGFLAVEFISIASGQTSSVGVSRFECAFGLSSSLKEDERIRQTVADGVTQSTLQLFENYSLPIASDVIDVRDPAIQRLDQIRKRLQAQRDDAQQELSPLLTQLGNIEGRLQTLLVQSAGLFGGSDTTVTGDVRSKRKQVNEEEATLKQQRKELRKRIAPLNDKVKSLNIQINNATRAIEQKEERNRLANQPKNRHLFFDVGVGDRAPNALPYASKRSASSNFPTWWEQRAGSKVTAASPFQWWALGTVVQADGGKLAQGRDSRSFKGVAGLSYQVRPELLIGLAARYQDQSQKTTDRVTDLDTQVFGLSAFSQFKLPHQINASVALAYEFAKNDVTHNGNIGAFDTNTVIAVAKMSRQIEIGDGWHLTPSARFNWSHSNQESYLNSAGTRIAGRNFDVAFGRVKTTLSKAFFVNDLPNTPLLASLVYWQPSFALSAGQFLERATPSSSSKTSSLVEETANYSARAALELFFENGTLINMATEAGFAEGTKTIWTVSGDIRTRFSLPGSDREMGQLSFGGKYTDLPDERSVWSLSAGLKIPF